MKSSIGTFALRFAATAVLLAPVAVAQAQSTSRTVCRDEAVPTPPGTFQPAKHVQVCDSVNYSPPPPPPPEPPAPRTIYSNSFVPYNPVAEARNAQLRATEHRDPPSSSSLCPPPYRMTARDGCQK
jgi:hypothetical protein